MNEINFFEEFGPAAFTAKFRAEGMYNFALQCLQPMLSIFCRALKPCRCGCKNIWTIRKRCFEFLTSHEAVAWVRHPTLVDHPSYDLVKKMLPRGAGSIIVFGLRGGRKAGKAFIEALNLASHLANVGDAKLSLYILPENHTLAYLRRRYD